jgi:hypothetical protein
VVVISLILNHLTILVFTTTIFIEGDDDEVFVVVKRRVVTLLCPSGKTVVTFWRRAEEGRP